MLGLKSPISIVWEITNNCNFKCPHCRAYQIYIEDSEEIENKIIEEIIKNEILTVNISGGEPLLNPRVIGIIKKLNDKQIYTGISTNGWLYNEKREELLNAGLKFIQISVDGPKELHEKFRGIEGSFDRAISALKQAKKDGLFTQMNVTITSNNIDTLEWNYKKALEIGVDKILYRRVVPAGKAKENNKVLPKKEKYIEKIKELMKLDSENLIVAIDDPIIYALKNDAENGLGCAAGIKSLGISSNGNIYPCIFLRTKIGNIKENSLSDIWNKSEILTRLRKKDIEECKKCRFRYSCGGCRAFSGIYSKDEMCPKQ